ncbi:MAG: alginate lyase family protein [Chloroflexi bacterium]|nr:alginate lyase family protein [Chloroflexota bacterium]
MLNNILRGLGLGAIFVLISVSCVSSPPTVAPAVESEGLLISNFEQDISIWQVYSQDTETVVNPGAPPPPGYFNVAKFHSKYTDRWVKPTSGFAASKEQVKEGQSAGKWENTVENNRLVAIDIPHDWSAYKYLAFWAYSIAANKAAIELVAYSETDQTSEDDYYKFEVVIDWTGWRKFEIPLKEFAATRNPVGWNKVDYIKIASTGWSHNPNPTTVLYFDAMRLSSVRTEASLSVKLAKQHPNLLLNASEIAEIKQKVATNDWAKSAYQAVSANAFVWSTRTIVLPETGGGYYHAGGEDYAITQAHYDLSSAARDLALMFQFTAEQSYAEKSKEILLAYAAKYASYEIHDKEGRTGEKASAGGRATAQGINEAAWVIPLAWAYDLIYDALTAAERERIENNLFRPAAELLMTNNEGRHNHQTWYNAGIGVIGFVLAEPEYVEHALNKTGSGFYYQMKNSVTADGMWYEGSMHYQFYVLQALGPLAEAAYHAGIDLYQTPGYKALFDFPMAYADASLRLPVINDGREVFLGASDRSRYYEAAYRRWGDPNYTHVLRASERKSLEALLYGAAELPPAAPPGWRSRDFSKSGLAVLRSGSDSNAKQVVLNLMGYAGGHSHPDQLGIVFFGLGRTLAPDAGSIKYEDPVQAAWYKQSLAHNLLVVNGKSQQRAPAGMLDEFAGGTLVQVARASTTKAYGGENLSRTLLLNDDYLTDLFQVNSPVENTYDWVYHNFGNLSTDLNMRPAPGFVSPSNGYEYLTNVQVAKTENAWRGDWTIAADQKVRLYMAGAPGTQIIAEEGLVAATVGDETSPEKVPVVIARRQAKSTRYVAIVEPYAASPAITQITPIPTSAADAVAWRITRGNVVDTLMVSDSRAASNFGDLTLEGNVAWFSSAGDEIQALYLGAGTRLASRNWSVGLENLVTASDATAVGVSIERESPRRLVVRNTSRVLTVIALAGLIPGNLHAFALDENGNRQGEVRPIESGEGRIRLFMDPGAVYEIIAN